MREVGVVEAFTAPWRGVVRPREVARRLAQLSVGGQIALFLTHCTLLAAVVVVLAMWNEAIGQFSPANTPEYSRVFAAFLLAYRFWFVWHADRWIGPAEWIAAVVFAVMIGGALLLVGISLVRVHRGGSLARSLSTTFAAVLSTGGAFTLAAVFVGVALLIANNWYVIGGYAQSLVEPIGALFSVPLGVLAVLANLRRAVAGVADLMPAPELSPRCEDCGYDLTHRPANDRCPECGLSVSVSLTPELRRPGCGWQNRLATSGWVRRMFAWIIDVPAIVFQPTEFYRGLRVRGGEGLTSAFALRVHVAMSLLGLAVSFLLAALVSWRYGGVALDACIIVAAIGGLWAPLALWALHRTVAALTTAWWIIGKRLTDFRTAAQVQDYEAAFLFVPGVFYAGLTTSFVLYGNWISRLGLPAIGPFGNPWGVPYELITVMGALFVFVIWWFVRYERILRAVRWSNF
ncbi:MAG: hypothetical protein D6744_17590 [Planctomycetota bacterium]|nr:MAG: hypothetical protein D6744_17590 [Planctomycetota bacterium]